MPTKLNDVYGEVMNEANNPEVVAETPIETPEEAPAETPVEAPVEAPVQEKPSIEDIIQAGQAQAQQMKSMSVEMQKLMEENEKLKSAVEQSQKVTTQQNEVAKETVINNQPKPQIDFGKMNFLSPEEQQAELEKVVNYMVQQKVGEIEGKVKPVLEKYAATERENIQAKTFEAIANSGKFPGFAENKTSINNIMANLDKLMPQLSGADIQQKYTIAYLIDQGYKNKPKSADDIVNEAIKNPEVLKKIREKTAKEQTETNKSIPTFSAVGSVPVAPAVKPKRIDDVTAEWRASLK